jgi:acyl-CoA synthetase (NDP forming)
VGAVDYVAKPFNAHELLARVNTHLTVDQLRRSLAGKNVELARAHELVRHAFGRYVSEEVAESILRAPEGLELGGEERETTILMSDLRGFTALAARLTPHEVIEVLNLYLETMVEVIGLYIEGFKEGAGRRFFEVTSRCRKPIIVYKAGRTEAGRQAAQSHTASIAGEYEVAKAAMKQAGLIVAGSMIAHGDFVKTFALLAGFRVAGRRVAVIANAGYEKTSAADNLGELELAELDDQTIGMLREHIPPMVEPGPLLDLTAMISDEQFERCIDVMLSSPSVDALCISILPQAQVLHTTDQEILSYEKNIAARIVSTVHKHKKPTVVSVNVVSGADAVYNRFGQVMDSGGVPTYLTAERAMVCLNEFIRYRLFKEKRVFSEWLR